MKFSNVSPLGDLDIPLVGVVVKAGETFEVRAGENAELIAAQCEGVLADHQDANYAPADEEAQALVDQLSGKTAHEGSEN